ncbi:hypothetical protein [Prevotella pallens]|uniref:hypothetical protein n=1 Tax=Prevotella pallens TaxID=60133 RepID=UPI0015F11B07|nr:hypothetical protein [Prevotella pallens]
MIRNNSIRTGGVECSQRVAARRDRFIVPERIWDYYVMTIEPLRTRWVGLYSGYSLG